MPTFLDYDVSRGIHIVTIKGGKMVAIFFEDTKTVPLACDKPSRPA